MHTEHLFRVHLYYWWALDFGVDLHKIPIWVLFYILCVIIHLRLIAGELLVAVGGYSGVSSNPAFLHCHLTWSRRAIDTLLSNEKYRGNSTASTARMSGDPRSKPRDKYLYQGHHEAIIDEETFIAVAEEKKRRSNIESDENGIRQKKTRYVAKVQIDEQDNRK